MSKREILNDMLDSVSDNYDKSDGSFIFNSLMPVAEQLEKTDEEIKLTEDKMYIENLYGQELEDRIYSETGIERRKATHAIGEVTLTGTGRIRTGDLFEGDKILFESTETKDISGSGKVAIRAVEPGARGNVPAQTITMFPITLSGFTDVINEQATYDGFDAESDTDLLERYYTKIRTPATSGNVYHYMLWATEVAGVGRARVIPLWDGDNTVKVVIIDSDRHPASAELVESVQEYIDPNSEGKGRGQAPIGAYCTVVSATGKEINVSADINLRTGTSLTQARNRFEAALTDYLANISFESDMVSFAQVGSILLNVEGVVDYTNLTINGGTTHIDIDNEEVAILGVVDLETD